MSVQPGSLALARQSVSNPITQRLPPEILSEIFVECLPIDEFIAPSVDTAPILVAQVCRRWKSVSMSTPKLWCSMKFNFQRQNGRFKTATFLAWLERSRNFPLSVCLWSDDLPSPQIIEAIIHVAHRLENIHFRLPVESWRSLTQVRSRLIQLRKINVEATPTNYLYSFRGGPFDVFAEAPRLDDVTVGFPVTFIMLPWSQISRLTIYGQQYRVKDLLHNLQKAIALDEFTISSCYGDPYSMNYPDPVTLSIRSLRVFQTLGPASSIMLDHMTFPKLQEITFDGIQAAWSRTGFQQLIRSSCHIKKLVLRNVAMSQDSLIECLRRLPSLVELKMEMTHPFLDNVVIRRLTQKGSKLPLVPNLRVLDLGGTFEFDDHVFANMVESRWHLRSPANIERLKLARLRYCHRVPNPSAITRLEEFRDQGLDLEVVMDVAR
jgi:hypothetical protein